MIEEIKKIKKTREKIKINQKPQPQPKPKPKPKTFEDYFQECIKNKIIPPDTPGYFRKALERAIREYEQGIEKEKSALEGFANKYVIKNKEENLMPLQFFGKNSTFLKEFLRNHRNIKVRFNLVCLMGKVDYKFLVSALTQKDYGQSAEILDKAYFLSDTYTNLESTNVKEILSKAIKVILEKLSIYLSNSSEWYLKKILYLKIHTVKYKPMRGGTYIPLPDWIMRKKAIVSICNKDNKCFIWSVLRYLHPREKNGSRLADLKKYEDEINTKGIKFPVRVKDISKFESLNPDIPGINVFSVYDKKKFYPLRRANKDPEKTIDLFYMKRMVIFIIH